MHVTLQTGEVCKPGADFSSVTRSNSDFEALMAYVHIDRARAYLESLGIQHLPERPLPVFADGTSEDESAYYTNDKSITFGTGGVDDAEDADVIVHEYGHAVQDEQVPDFGDSLQGGAMGEGFGDYFQAALDAQRAPSATFNPCLGEWDSSEIVKAAPVQCLRRTDTNRTVAQVGPGTSCNTEPHCAGEVWSSALWTIRGLIGGPTADRLVVQSHYALTKTADFVDGATALILTDRALYGGVHEQLLRQVLGARGLFEPKWLTLRLSAQLPSIRTLRRTKRFAVAIDISEAGRVRLTALLVGGAKHGSVVKARTATFRSDGERRVGLTLTRAGLRLLRKRRSVVLRIRAQATFSRGRTLPVVQVRRRTH